PVKRSTNAAAYVPVRARNLGRLIAKRRSGVVRFAFRQIFVSAEADMRHSEPRRSCVPAAIVAATAVVFIVVQPGVRAHTKTTLVTWTVDVAPIVQSRCVGCHRTDGFGPMSLATYADAKLWTKAIRDEVLSGRMPPWS